MLIKHINGDSEPQQIRYKIRLGLREYTIAFDVQESTEEQEDSQKYSWTEATFSLGTPSYSDLTAAIIKGRYNDNDMTALINNHLLNDGSEEHEAEWNAMQEWRTGAKKTAKEIITEISRDYG